MTDRSGKTENTACTHALSANHFLKEEVTATATATLQLEKIKML